MTAFTLPAEFGRIVGDDEDVEPKWLADKLISADGVTAITGASKSGKTTLAIECVQALRDRKSHGGYVLDAWIEAEVRRVLVIATHGQHAQYVRAFRGDSDVAIVDVVGAPQPGFWRAYADAAEQFEADLVVIDTVQSFAGAGTPENIQGLAGFGCPVLGVFLGFAGTAGVKDGDEYRALAISSLGLKRDSKTGELSVSIACRWAAERTFAPYVPKHGDEPAPTPSAGPRAGLTAQQVGALAGLTRTLSHRGGGISTLVDKLFAEQYQGVMSIAGTSVTPREVTAAAQTHRAAWDAAAYGGSGAKQPLSDEPPF